MGVEIISTGGTADRIRELGVNVTDIQDVTDYPECLDGRVKTLHPAVHAGILARTSHKPDREELKQLGIEPIDLVVANLYPFRETIQESSDLATATEYIDIGGPTLIRAAAKNFAHVAVLTNPGQYEQFNSELEQQKEIPYKLRQQLARDAFNHTAEYDQYIANYFNDRDENENPVQFNLSLPRSQNLRYGENPHQKAAVYGFQDQYIDCFHGKELSYNNYMDLDAAVNLFYDFRYSDPTCAIFKHTQPCGVASAPNLEQAYKNAFATDKISPFGGIVLVNRELDLSTAEAIDEIFTEIIIAPAFSDEALELLKQKEKRRLIKLHDVAESRPERTFRSIFGGALNQDPDRENIDPANYKVVTKRKPSDREWSDLAFAWKIVKHVKSNAIVYAGKNRTLGIGSGQPSRVDSSEIAVRKADKEGLSLENSVIASDAFFPFADGVEAAAEAGARAVIQPGGSIRDQEVIDMANEKDMAMVFTGKRHFRH
jgi:phosphoribosylaminoimidazolecarboxamide formyltransferase/IMP cyclohydrolase